MSEQLITRTQQFLPELNDIEVPEVLSSIRSFDPIVIDRSKNFKSGQNRKWALEAWSEKIIHCVSGSEEISDLADHHRYTM